MFEFLKIKEEPVKVYCCPVGRKYMIVMKGASREQFELLNESLSLFKKGKEGLLVLGATDIKVKKVK